MSKDGKVVPLRPRGVPRAPREHASDLFAGLENALRLIWLESVHPKKLWPEEHLFMKASVPVGTLGLEEVSPLSLQVEYVRGIGPDAVYRRATSEVPSKKLVSLVLRDDRHAMVEELIAVLRALRDEALGPDWRPPYERGKEPKPLAHRVLPKGWRRFGRRSR